MIFCFCGRLTSIKGVYDLIDVWGRVLKYFPQSKLVIIGQGPEYDNMLKLIRNKALDKSITLTGFISRLAFRLQRLESVSRPYVANVAMYP